LEIPTVFGPLCQGVCGEDLGLNVTLVRSVTRRGQVTMTRWLFLRIPDSNKVLTSTLEQPQRARTVHKVRDVTLGRRRG
jgi:hypothetical protein